MIQELDIKCNDGGDPRCSGLAKKPVYEIENENDLDFELNYEQVDEIAMKLNDFNGSADERHQRSDSFSVIISITDDQRKKLKEKGPSPFKKSGKWMIELEIQKNVCNWCGSDL